MNSATPEIYTLSLHDALPILGRGSVEDHGVSRESASWRRGERREDRKSTRLNSSHDQTSYAVFCLKQKIHTSQNSQPISSDLWASEKARVYKASVVKTDVCPE